MSSSFEMSTAMAIVLLRDFGWLKPETTLARNGEQGLGGGVPWLETMLGEASTQCLHDER